MILGGAAIRDPESSSGRLDLAEWLSADGNPLTARVIVNRLWLWHFGRGIVTTPNDFGVRGAAPSHPELLDWLATELVDNEWSIKHMHRVIMNSRCYQLSSQSNGDLSPADELTRTQNFGRFPQRRLDAESIRDAMLTVSRASRPDTWYTTSVPVSGQVGLHTTWSILRRLRNEEAERLRDAAAVKGSSLLLAFRCGRP